MFKKLTMTLLSGMLLVSMVACDEGEEVQDTGEVIEYDIAVVGGGGAGLSAAVSAAEEGAEVVVVEKMPMLGGNTLRATGGLNAAETTFQDEEGIEDSVDVFYEDTMTGGGEENDPELVEVMTENSASIVEWLTELGADLSDVGSMGGASNARTHRPAGGEPVGPEVVTTLDAAAEEQGVDVLLETTVTEILTDDEGKASGLQVEDEEGAFEINAESVIVTTGGFGGNEDMITEYDAELEGYATTNHPGATGSGIEIAQEIGVDVVDMDMIQIHPTVVEEGGNMITEAVRGNGAILVNKDGERFVDELETRAVVSEAILNQEGESAFLFFDEKVRDSLGAIEGYVDQGLVTKGESIEELANELEIPAEELEETVEKYNSFVEEENDADFERENMAMNLDEASFYAIEITPATHHTMGGLNINTEAQVIGEDGEIIPGLYAAGECTGGIHGNNRLGGNALTDITVFGRIAGQNAASELE
ncbi:flavocytochrome c [Natranaerobius trueperi]|uniref:Flavocytochrome c n=1 Tax=Natranaerobius trueperi TaxID=759412 RepID=A0A226C031_9FIRM|nr:flavocytochrome c [Natranaerobius trueperi]OWZ84648.1 flavocytochrome c [Natranaerobius trueperi]